MKRLTLFLVGSIAMSIGCSEQGDGIPDAPTAELKGKTPVFNAEKNKEDARRFVEAHSARRDQVLKLDGNQMGGMKGAPVWAVLMEMGFDKDTDSTVAYADGTAGFFSSSSDKGVEGEGHPYVQAAALNLVKMAENFLKNTEKVGSYPVPRAYGDLACYVVTPKGVFGYFVNTEDLGKKEQHKFRKLFEQWGELQSQYTIVEEKRYAEQARSNGLDGNGEAEPDLDLTGIDWGAKDENPVNPEEFEKLLKKANRVVVTASPVDKNILYHSDEKSDIDELIKGLSISKPEQWYHCMCIGTMVVSLYKGEEELVKFSNHHGKSIRCSLWDSDAVIDDKESWLAWFDKRSMPQLRNEVEESRARQKKSARTWEKWLAAMPEGVHAAWESSYGEDGVFDVNPLRKALAKSYPEKRDRILALLKWYGSGEGPWNSYPLYEGWAVSLIGDYDAAEIVSAIDHSKLTDEQFEGAARFIAQSNYPQDYPKELKKSLWDYVKNTKDEDKRARARALIE